MRLFPGAFALALLNAHTPRSRRHLLTGLLSAMLIATTATAPIAGADDERHLRQEQREVRQQIISAETGLQHTSRRVATTARRLQQASDDLRDARTRLQQVRRRLDEARLRRVRSTRRLDDAQVRVVDAARALQEARVEVSEQRRSMRDMVLTWTTTGSPQLALMSSLVNAGSLEEVLVANTVSSMAIGREDQTLEALKLAQSAFANARDVAERARDHLAARQAASVRAVDRVQFLFEESRSSRARVRRLVDQSHIARRAALSAQARDRRLLRHLDAREQRIRRQILALADHNSGFVHNGDVDSLLQFPVAGTITSPYGYRTHPIYGYYSLHDGVDIGAPCGAPLWAGESGTVLRTYYDNAYGNRLFLSIGRVNGADFTLVYNHMERAAVAEGSAVDRGDVVGYVGNTGWSTGCHVHFTVLRNGEPVDPMDYM